MGRKLVQERHLPWSEAPGKGSQTKEACVLQVTINYISSACTCSKKQSQDKKPLPKGDKEGVTIHSPNNTHSFWPVASDQPSVMGGGGAVSIDPPAVKTFYFYLLPHCFLSVKDADK